MAPRLMAAFNRLMVEAEGEDILSTKSKELITVVRARAQPVLDALEAFSEIEDRKKLEVTQAELVIDIDFKELYNKLLVYVQDICNEAECARTMVIHYE